MNNPATGDNLREDDDQPKDDDAPMIERAEIERAFQICLRRPVDSEAAFAFFHGLGTVEDVYATLFDSPEFRGRLQPPKHETGAIPMPIELDAGPAAMARMAAHVEATWTRLGETEPHWSVITEPRFAAANFAANAAEFHEYGRLDDARLAAAAARAGLDLARHHTCLELGCGTGRMTGHLAQRFPHIIAADVSAAHLAEARTALEQAGVTNVRLLHLPRLEALATLPPYDMLYCRIVLQHNPPPLIAAILRQILAGLAPGGAGLVQVPVWIPGYRFAVADYLAGLHTGPMEMHAIPQHALLAIVQDSGCQVLELREDALGPQFGGISNTLLIEKRTAPRDGAIAPE